jgi:hypothetical protein
MMGRSDTAAPRRRWPALAAPLLVLVLVLLASAASAGRNYYDVLSVPKHAGEQQIKRAYRKLALQYHPDKVGGTEEQKAEAAKRFAEINAAYEALSGAFGGWVGWGVGGLGLGWGVGDGVLGWGVVE